MSDKVQYDSRSTRTNLPYRSEALYRADRDAVLRMLKPGPVDVIVSHGDEEWTHGATVESYRHIGDFGGTVFAVRLRNGKRFEVAEDRIRPARIVVSLLHCECAVMLPGETCDACTDQRNPLRWDEVKRQYGIGPEYEDLHLVRY